MFDRNLKERRGAAAHEWKSAPPVDRHHFFPPSSISSLVWRVNGGEANAVILVLFRGSATGHGMPLSPSTPRSGSSRD